jgi:hypothetical protein
MVVHVSNRKDLLMRSRWHLPSASIVVACIALVLVLGGTSLAAASAVPNNSVGTAQLKNNAVTAAKIASNAVTSAKVAANAVGSAKIANNAVTNAKLASNAVTNSKISANSVTSARVENQSLLSEDFAPGQLPQGPRGPQGPPGKIGTLILRANSATIAKNNSTEIGAKCNSGEQAISGGATWKSKGDFNETLVYSGPVYDSSAGKATGWLARGRNQTGGDQTFIVQVLCGSS